MKIVILCPFSYPSICGVWTRVYEDAKYLIEQGHEVHVFSSNIIKGTKQKSGHYELFEGIHIHRFTTIMSWGENTNFWFFTRQLMKINPDIIHSHIYRHPETNISAFLAWIMKKPFLLTTHAPFVEKKLRGRFMNIMVSFHDAILSKIFFPRCSKVIAITKWEFPYLKELGCPKEKIVYIPNGISDVFFKVKPKKTNSILFLGRIAPIKNLECLLNALKILKEKGAKFNLNIVGPAEESYLYRLKQLCKLYDIEKHVNFKEPIFDINKKLEEYKNNSIFILPSWREAMPTVLLEAGASGLTIISSKTEGGKEIIQNNKTGYLFNINNEKQLAEKIKLAIKKPISAKGIIKKFSLKNTNPRLENVYKSLIH